MLLRSHEQPSGLSRYQCKAIGSIEFHGAVILSIDDDGESADTEAIGADCRIEDEGSAQPPPLIFRGNREAAHEHGRHERIARQPIGQIGWQSIDGNACRREGVEARNGPCIVERHEASGNTSPHVLQRKFS
jgi:hypothetical protein